MMFKAATLLTVLSSPLLVDGAPCLDSVGDATVIDTNSCSYNTLVTALEGVLADIDGCDNTAEEELQEIFGVDSESDVQEEIARRCNDAVDVLDFESLTGRGEIFDKEYYDGGTYWNEEREYYKNKIPEDKLKTDPGQRIDYIKRNLAEKDHITWPDYMDNFEDCELRAAMCCFVQDRQARDNNGNCIDHMKRIALMPILVTILIFATPTCHVHQHQVVRMRDLLSLKMTSKIAHIAMVLLGHKMQVINPLASRETISSLFQCLTTSTKEDTSVMSLVPQCVAV